MPGYSYAPSGAGAAYMGMMGHLGPMRESRGPSPYGAASYGLYGGRAGTDTNRGYMQRPEPRSSGYKPLSSAPRGSSMFSSSASGDRSSQHSSRSPHTPSFASRSSGPSNTPRGSSLFSSSASGSRGSQHPLSSPYSSRSSSYNAPSNTPRGSSLFDPSTSGNSRGSQHPSRSRSSASPYSSGSSGYPGYRSSKSFMTDYPPRGGWFPSYGYR